MGLINHQFSYMDFDGDFKPDFPQEYTGVIDHNRNFPVRIMGTVPRLSTSSGRPLISGTFSYYSHVTFSAVILRHMFGNGNHDHDSNTSGGQTVYYNNFTGWFEPTDGVGALRLEMKDVAGNITSLEQQNGLILGRTISKTEDDPRITETVEFIGAQESDLSTSAISSKVSDKGYNIHNAFTSDFYFSTTQSETNWSGKLVSGVKRWTVTERTGFEYAVGGQGLNHVLTNGIVQNPDNASVEIEFTVDMTTDTTWWTYAKNGQLGSVKIGMTNGATYAGAPFKQDMIFNRVIVQESDQSMTQENPTEQTFKIVVEAPVSGDALSYSLNDLDTKTGW